MALYTNTLTCTWLKLQTALSGAGTLTANTSITVSDPTNVVIGNSNTTGTLGYLIKKYTGSYLLDFTPSDFSTATYTANSNSLFYNCTKLSGMCKLPSSITNAFRMFSGCTGLTSIDTSAFKNVKYASSMFYNCAGLTSRDTTAFTNVTDANYMFYDCTGLTSIDTSAFKNVKYATYMFTGCTRLTSIDTTAFTNVTGASWMFQSCTGLTSIDTSGFTNVTDASSMFNGCTSLKSIYMINCKLSLSSKPKSNNNFMTSVPADCMFYVAPDSYDTWYSRLYTNYANWGLSVAKTPTLKPTLNKVYIYRRIA